MFVGSVDQGLANAIRRSVDDAGGRVALVRALRVPLDPEAVDAALGAEPDTRGLAGVDNRDRLGRELARELVAAGPNPVFDRLARVIVEEQSGAAGTSARRRRRREAGRSAAGRDGAVPRGSLQRPRRGPVPAVGVEKSNARTSAVPVFHLRGLATVDGVDDAAGQVALVFLLAGARPGSYGVGNDATDGIIPDPPPPPVASKG